MRGLVSSPSTLGQNTAAHDLAAFVRPGPRQGFNTLHHADPLPRPLLSCPVHPPSKTTTMKGSNAATPVSAGDTLIMDKTAAAAGSSPTAVLDSQPGASTPVSPQEVGGGSAPAGAQGAADSSAQAAAARAGARGNGGGGGDACPGRSPSAKKARQV